MSKRISKQEIIAINEATEIIKARTADIKEASRIARRNGKSND